MGMYTSMEFTAKISKFAEELLSEIWSKSRYPNYISTTYVFRKIIEYHNNLDEFYFEIHGFDIDDWIERHMPKIENIKLLFVEGCKVDTKNSEIKDNFWHYCGYYKLTGQNSEENFELLIGLLIEEPTTIKIPFVDDYDGKSRYEKIDPIKIMVNNNFGEIEVYVR